MTTDERDPELIAIPEEELDANLLAEIEEDTRALLAEEVELVPVLTRSQGEARYGAVKWWTSPQYEESVEAEEISQFMAAFEEEDLPVYPDEVEPSEP